jgi:hypothetical protein
MYIICTKVELLYLKGKGEQHDRSKKLKERI